MRIGFDAKRAFFNTRGLGNYSRNTIGVLTKYNPNEDFYLFTPSVRNGMEFPCGKGSELVEPHGLYKQFPSIWRTFGIPSDVNRLGIDVYHGLSNELPVGIEKTKAHSVLTVHDLIYLQMPQLYPWIDRQLYKKKYISSCRRADVIIAISQQTKSDLINFIGIKEEKIRDVFFQSCNPIFLNQSTVAEKQNVKQRYNLPDQYLLSVGAIEERKNQKLILEALVVGKIDVPVVILGRPTSYLKEIEAYIHENKLDEKVKILQNIPFEDLPTIYQLSTIFVYPSFFEGFGAPILEALNSCVPVVTTKGGCFEETGGPNSCYVDPYSPEELAMVLKDILDDTQRQNRMKEAGLKHASLFSEERNSEIFMSIYRSLV